MAPKTLVLIVDDEPDLVAPLEYALQREGFATRCAGDGEGALAGANQAPTPDLVLLDLMLPDMPGTEVFRRLRGRPETARIPVIMVTAKGEESDRVLGLELGADDYVTKPFSTRELILRVRAVLRRGAQGESGPADEGSVRFGRLRIDPAAHEAWVDQAPVLLTALEFRLLMVLYERRGRVQDRDTLIRLAWGDAVHVSERTVDTHVKRLRSKLGPAGAYIETTRGVGYRLVRDPPLSG